MPAPAETPTSADEKIIVESPTHTTDFGSILRDESAWIARRRSAAGLPPPQGDSVGLALSGPGMRAAAFNLGVVQALESRGLMRHVDYLSSVSGGGFIATCYSWLRAVLPASDAPTFSAQLANGSGSVVDWLRGHARYFVAHRGFSLWTMFGAVLAAVVLNLLVLGPPLLLVVDTLTLGWLWLPIEWPSFLAWSALDDHHGYWLLLALGCACLALFPFAAMLFALTTGVAHTPSERTVMRMRKLLGFLLAAAVVLLVIGSVPIATAALESLLARRWADAVGLAGHVAVVSTLGSGVLALWRGATGLTVARQRLATAGLLLVLYGLMIAAYSISVQGDVVRSAAFPAVLALSLLLGCFCNLNAVSIHAYFRDRLGRTFMPQVTGAPSATRFMLSQLSPDTGAPLHLVNCTLDTRSSRREKERSREGASFVYSPLHFGSDATGFGRVDAARDDMRYITASTISSAELDSESPATRSRALSLLLTLLNLRIGYWTRNPDPTARRGLPLPSWWRRLGSEMSGIGLHGRHRDLLLVGGGEFDNLGLYELVRRGVKHLIVIDGACDPHDALPDFGAAIERARVDFGASIEIDIPGEEPDPSRLAPDHRVGSITYADGSSGHLLYLKPAMHAGASAEIQSYWRSHPDFPHEATADQTLDEQQFEAYRQLGREAVESVLGDTHCADFSQWVERHVGGETPHDAA
jgi:hypothetical protein